MLSILKSSALFVIISPSPEGQSVEITGVISFSSKNFFRKKVKCNPYYAYNKNYLQIIF